MSADTRSSTDGGDADVGLELVLRAEQSVRHVYRTVADTEGAGGHASKSPSTLWPLSGISGAQEKQQFQ